MKTFKLAAYKVLSEAGKELHSKKITERAIKAGYLLTAGKTPEATMNALLLVDVNKKGSKSIFKKVGPSTFTLNKKTSSKDVEKRLAEETHPISKTVSSKQKGDIGEGRIAELITLYGEGLSCYKPISDDEGVDIVVKKRKGVKTFHIQVKTRFGTSANTSLIAHVKKQNVTASDMMGLVFCFFDTEEGDVWDYLWFVPSKDFTRLAKLSANKKLGPIYKFVAGRSRKEGNKWDKYLIDKRELGDKIGQLLK